MFWVREGDSRSNKSSAARDLFSRLRSVNDPE